MWNAVVAQFQLAMGEVLLWDKKKKKRDKASSLDGCVVSIFWSFSFKSIFIMLFSVPEQFLTSFGFESIFAKLFLVPINSSSSFAQTNFYWAFLISGQFFTVLPLQISVELKWNCYEWFEFNKGCCVNMAFSYGNECLKLLIGQKPRLVYGGLKRHINFY